MTTSEIIQRLREETEQYKIHPMRNLLNEAADRLEELDERIDIMAADMDSAWGNMP